MLAAATITVAVLLPAVPGGGAPQPLSLSLSGADARVDLPNPDAVILPCASGGSTSYHHYTDQALAGGILSNLAGRARTNLDLYAQGPPEGFLLEDQSHVTLSNQRGAVRLALRAGSCEDPTVAFDGETASGTGTWTLDPAYTTDAYRQATGSGTFTFTTRLTPGNQNPWQFDLSGTIGVLQPALSATMVKSYWGRLGADYAGRVLTVVFRVTNTGPGDAFNARVLVPTASTGILPLDFTPEHLGDLNAGESFDLTVHYKVGLRGAKQGPLLVRRQFDTVLHVVLPDALDVTTTVDRTVTVTAPGNPPPL